MKANLSSSKAASIKAAAAEAARVAQLRDSARATMKEKGASLTATIRALAKRLPSTPRRDFMKAFTARPFKLSPNTVSTQYQWGRSGRR